MTRRRLRAHWPLPAATALIGLAGATGVPAVFALGAGLGLATVGAWAAVLVAARRLQIARTVQVREVREDEPLRLRFDVRGVSRLPVALEVQDGSGAWVGLAGRGGTLAVASGPRGVLVVVILLFGAKKLPELARGIGQSLGEFKKARDEFDREVRKSTADLEVKEPVQDGPQPS